MSTSGEPIAQLPIHLDNPHILVDERNTETHGVHDTSELLFRRTPGFLRPFAMRHVKAVDVLHIPPLAPAPGSN